MDTVREALSNLCDELIGLGFNRQEDWFVKHEGEEYMEQIHIDTLDMLARCRIATAALASQEAQSTDAPIVNKFGDTMRPEIQRALKGMVEHVRATLAAAPAQPPHDMSREAGAWQPIETAPKDGTLILGYDAKFRDREKHAGDYTGRWKDGDGEQYRVSPYEAVVWLEKERQQWYCVDQDTMKRRTADWSHWARSQGWWQPTHWMPLPAPPQPADKP